MSRGMKQMVFRLSRKLAKWIKIQPGITAPLSGNPFLDWTAHIFFAGKMPYVIVTNTSSLLSIIFSGKGISDDNVFVMRCLSYMKEYLSDEPFTFFFPRIIGPHMDKVLYLRSTDQRVIGSMNDLVRNARVHLIEDGLSPLRASQKINEMPMSYLDYDTPERAFLRSRL